MLAPNRLSSRRSVLTQVGAAVALLDRARDSLDQPLLEQQVDNQERQTESTARALYTA
jgi:hypothetical protein